MRKKILIRYKDNYYSITISLLSNKDWKRLYAFFKSNWIISQKIKFPDWKASIISEEILQYECKSKSEYDLLILRIRKLAF